MLNDSTFLLYFIGFDAILRIIKVHCPRITNDYNIFLCLHQSAITYQIFSKWISFWSCFFWLKFSNKSVFQFCVFLPWFIDFFFSSFSSLLYRLFYCLLFISWPHCLCITKFMFSKFNIQTYFNFKLTHVHI